MAGVLAGCGGDDDASDGEAESYSVDVERITDEISRQGDAAIGALNRFAEGQLEAGPTATRLDQAATVVGEAEAELRGLDAPEAAAGSAGDLAFSVSDLTRQLQSAAGEVRATARGLRDRLLVARNQASLVLAYQSGVSALSRAVRSLAAE